MPGSSTESTLLRGRTGLRLVGLVAGLSDAGDFTVGSGKAESLGHGGLLGTDVVHELGESLELPTARPTEDPLFDLHVPHAVYDDLLDDLVSIRHFSVTAFLGTSQSHTTHVSCSRDSSDKSSDSLIRFLNHLIQIHKVNRLVYLDDGQLLHPGQERIHCSQAAVVSRVVHSLSEILITSSAEL